MIQVRRAGHGGAAPQPNEQVPSIWPETWLTVRSVEDQRFKFGGTGPGRSYIRDARLVRMSSQSRRELEGLPIAEIISNDPIPGGTEVGGMASAIPSVSVGVAQDGIFGACPFVVDQLAEHLVRHLPNHPDAMVFARSYGRPLREDNPGPVNPPAAKRTSRPDLRSAQPSATGAAVVAQAASDTVQSRCVLISQVIVARPRQGCR